MMLSQLWILGWESALFDHLWQSTAVAMVAWLLTVALRKNSARVRYHVWMFASIKFLIPLRLLREIGERWAKPAIHDSQAGFYLFVEQFSRPFQHPQLPAPPVAATAASTHAMPIVWVLIAAVWFSGCMVLVARWISDWRRVRAMVTAARRVEKGREFEALQRAQCRAQIREPLALRLSSSAIEPGVFGALRPTLLWPAGLSDRLDETQMEAIMSHEVEHIRRRDNLSCAVHALVESLFWFHPLVRWMSGRMTEERERACDEKVMQLNARPEAYAESILKVCGFCLEPPTPCVSAVSGADLKERVLRIMTRRSVVALSLGRKLMLAAAALLVLALPVGFGAVRGESVHSAAEVTTQASGSAAELPKYEVATIKPTTENEEQRTMMMTPDGTSMHSVDLQMLLQQAFAVESDRIVGTPAWAKTKRYDIEAKVAPEEAPKIEKLKREQRAEMLLPLLEERFGLKYHHETRELTIYTLVPAKGGPKLTPSKLDSAPLGDLGATAGPKGPPKDPIGNRGTMRMMPGSIESHGTGMTFLAHALSGVLGRTVIDQTALTGTYDFALHWTPDEAMMPMGPRGGEGAPPKGDALPDAGGPSLFTAIQDQLGLKLESQKIKADVIVIDRIDPPSQN